MDIPIHLNLHKVKNQLDSASMQSDSYQISSANHRTKARLVWCDVGHKVTKYTFRGSNSANLINALYCSLEVIAEVQILSLKSRPHFGRT